MQQQQMLGEVWTISKKEKRVREIRRKWGERKKQKQLDGEETVSEKDRRIRGVGRAWEVREIANVF